MKIVATLAHRPTADRPDQLGMADLMSLLNAYGIVCAAARLARSADEAVAAATAIGFPVAIKIVSPDIPRKAEAGGVVLDLADARAVHRATAAMFGRIASACPAAVIHGVLVQSMAPAGWELFLAGGREGDDGPVVSVGGGFGAWATRALEPTAGGPTAPAPPAEMHPGLDGLISRFARLLADHPELTSVEIDPLIVGSAGSVAVDARARRVDGEQPWS